MKAFQFLISSETKFLKSMDRGFLWLSSNAAHVIFIFLITWKVDILQSIQLRGKDTHFHFATENVV